MTAASCRELVLRFIRAAEAGDVHAADALLAADVVQEELPSLLFPRGGRHDRAAMRAAGERGRATVADQRYEIVATLAEGSRVAVEIAWSARLRVAAGSWPAGHVVRAHVAMFFDVEDGRIARIRNYDCYEVA